jgi:hypothetical protein
MEQIALIKKVNTHKKFSLRQKYNSQRKFNYRETLSPIQN